MGCNSTFLRGLTIGNDSVKVANSPVNKDEPSYAIVGGRLIKIIRFSFPIKPLKNYKKAEIVGFSC